MNVKLINKCDPTEIRYTLEIGESQLKNIHASLCRNRLNNTSPNKLDHERLEAEIREILHASATN